MTNLPAPSFAASSAQQKACTVDIRLPPFVNAYFAAAFASPLPHKVICIVIIAFGVYLAVGIQVHAIL